MTDSKKVVALTFKWNAETTSQAANLYALSLGATVEKGSLKFGDTKPTNDQHVAANSDASLNKIAMEIGAKSGRAVRGKLAKEGIYWTLEPQSAPSTSSRISKGQYVRSLAKGLDLDMEAVQTLDKANLDALETLTEGVNKILTAAGQEVIKVA